MKHWRLDEIETPDGTRSPVVLHSRDGAERVVLIELNPGDALGDHQVRESGVVVVVGGTVRIEAGDESFDAGAGEVFHFEPGERHSVTSETGGRILMMLAPWPAVSASS
jgi:quercetin dioxygenase-like cupin family protein